VIRLTIVSVLFIMLLAASCTYITGEAPERTPAVALTPAVSTEAGSLPEPESALPFEIKISTAPAHLPGEQIMFGIGIINKSSGTITIDPYSPARWIKRVGQNDVVYSSAAGTRTYDVKADHPFIPTKAIWDQKDNKGSQVQPGWYEIGYEYRIIEENTAEIYTVVPTARFQIVSPDSAMYKDLEVNRSVSVKDIKATLERIEMNPVQVKVYVFTTPPGYTLPQPGSLEEPSAFVQNSKAEYSIDGGMVKEAVHAGAEFNKDGATIIWHIDPIPVNAKELTFTVTRLGDREGVWQFKIKLY
jgi:hypothetical protein